jgi:hypothetical protein
LRLIGLADICDAPVCGAIAVFRGGGERAQRLRGLPRRNEFEE